MGPRMESVSKGASKSAEETLPIVEVNADNTAARLRAPDGVPSRPRREQRYVEARRQMQERVTHWIECSNPEALFSHISHRRRMARILDLLRDVTGRVLDVGPFIGILSERIIAQGGKEVYGIDAHEAALKLAAKRGVVPVLADVEDEGVPFQDGWFDGAVMGDVLGYLMDANFVLGEIHRVLKPGAKFVLTAPNLVSVGNRLLALLGHGPYDLDVRPFGGGYQRYYTFDSVRMILQSRGFEVVSIETNHVHWPLHRLPLTHHLFDAKVGSKRGRMLYWHWLARLWPRLGEDMIVLARKRG